MKKTQYTSRKIAYRPDTHPSRNAEILVKKKLWQYGLRVKDYGNTRCPFDLVINDNIFIDVKYSSIRTDKNNPLWSFTSNKNDIDYYAFVLGGLPKKNIFFIQATKMKKPWRFFSLNDFLTNKDFFQNPKQLKIINKFKKKK